MTTICTIGLNFRLNFVAGMKRLYIMMQKNVKTGILLSFDAKIFTKMRTKYLKYHLWQARSKSENLGRYLAFFHGGGGSALKQFASS